MGWFEGGNLKYSTLLDIHPDVDMDCNVTLEEVVQKWMKMADETVVSNASQIKAEANGRIKISKNSRKGNSFLKDDSTVHHNNKGKNWKRTLILDDVKNAENENENKLIKKREDELKVKVAKKTRSKICRRGRHRFTPEEDSTVLNK